MVICMTKHSESTSRYRWVVLILFMFVALLSQLLWLTFAPISSEMEKLYNITAFDVSILSLVWPLVFVVLAIPAGIFIDKYGFKKSVGFGSMFLAVFAIIRMFSVNLGYDFTLLLIAQTGAAISQPFIFGSVTKLAATWFSEEERGLATGLGSIGLFLGMMLALVLTPMLFLEFGYSGMLLTYGLLSCVGALLFLIFTKEKEEMCKLDSDLSFSLSDMWSLSKSRDFFFLEFGFFAVVGGFTAITTWLEAILNDLHGIGIDQAGLVGGLLIIGGIIGSIVIPELSDRTQKIKPFILVDILIGTLGLFLIAIVSDVMLLYLISFVTGIFLMSALPLVLELSSRIAQVGMEGRASSLLWFFSQVGSVVLIAVIEPMKEMFDGYFYSIILIVVLWLMSFGLIVFIKKEKKGIKN